MSPEEEYDALAAKDRAVAPKRLLPHSEVAERATICCIIIAPPEVLQYCEELGIGTEHFHHSPRGQIFRVLRAMHDEHKPIDAMTLCVELGNRGVIDQVGGFTEIAELAGYLPSAQNVRAHLTTLCEKHTLRQVAAVSTRFHERAHEDQDNVDGVIEEFEKQVMAIRPSGRNVRCYSGKDIARMAMESLGRRLEQHDEIQGLTTGFPDLDLKTDGMHETELIVVAGRPGSGKSSFCGQICEHLAINVNIPCGEFSLEMGAQLYSERRVVSRARVNTAPWRGGRKPTHEELQRIHDAAHAYHPAPYYVEELSDATVQHLRTAARRMVQQHGVKLIVVDSLSKLRSNSKQARDSREREVSEAIGGCKEIAKELKIPVMVIAHLKRNEHLKPGQQPSLTDLRESGAIEQDADSVWMLYEREDKKTGLYMPKQRAGAPDEECAFWFERQHTRFRPAQTEDEEADAEVRRQREFQL